MNSKYDFMTLHEGFLKDIFDIVVDMKNSDSFDDVLGKLKNLGPIAGKSQDSFNVNIGKNIAKAAQGLTATFPLIVTEATPVEQAVMVSKAVERKCCALLQMLFAANQITSASSAHNYVSRFHQNLADDDHDLSGYSVDDIIEKSHDAVSAQHESYQYKAIVNKCIDEVIEDCRRNIHYHLGEGLNPDSIGNYTVKKVFNEISISRTGTNTDITQQDDVYFDPNDPNSRVGTITNRTVTKTGADVNDIKNSYEVLNKGIIKTDVQKANEATPSLLIVNFKTTGNTEVIHSTCVIGVKVVIHYVSSADMANKLVMKNTDNRGLFNFIRATTREISFFKDFLFSVDRAKIDALSKIGKGSTSSLWKMLELRAHNAKYNKVKNKSDASCSAIATIVISKAEADIIKKQYRVDVTKASTLLGIMRGYSFMAGVIIDDTLEKVDFLWDDGSDHFETLSFMSLEREDSGGMYKKVINMMARR